MAEDIQSNIDLNIDTTSALASIKTLQSQISAFHTSMAKSGAAANAVSSQLQQNLLNSVNATGKFSASIDTVKTSSESFTTALEKNKLSLGQYFRYAAGASKSFSGLFKSEFETINKVARERVKDLQTQYIKLGRDANGAMKAIAIRPLALDMENLGTKTAIAAQRQQLLNQLLQQGSTNLLNFGKNTQWAGRQLMVGFTIPLSIAGTAAAKAYMDIEKASIAIKRVYGDLSTSTAETNRMVAEIKNLATEYTKFGLTVADTMQMAAKAAAMGKTGADLLDQVGNAAKLAALGGVDQNMALETTISLTNAFGLSADQLAGKVNFLNAVENQTVLSIEDMTTAIPKAAPVIKQLGGNVEDLAFFMTAMKEGGINASEGANAIKSGLSALINPTKKASDFLAGFGINLNGIVQKNKGDVKGTVIEFAKALDTLDPLNRARAIEQMFGKFQFARISTLMQNVVKDGSQASKALEIAGMSSIQLAAMSRRELDKLSSSPMYKFQKAMADLQLKMAPIGEAFLKAVTPVINFVSDMLKGFNNLGEGMKGGIVVAIAVIGGLAPILLMVTGLVANGAANILKFLTGIKNFFNKTGSATQVLGEQVNYLTTEQIKAESVAASLDQIHTKLRQTFTSEASAVNQLTAALQAGVVAQEAYRTVAPTSPMQIGPRRQSGKFANGGIISGPGTGTSDSIVAMVSNGEAIIPASSVAKNPRLISSLISGNIPKFAEGTINVGGKSVNVASAGSAKSIASRGKIFESTPDLQGAWQRALESVVKTAEVTASGALKVTLGRVAAEAKTIIESEGIKKGSEVTRFFRGEERFRGAKRQGSVSENLRKDYQNVVPGYQGDQAASYELGMVEAQRAAALKTRKRLGYNTESSGLLTTAAHFVDVPKNRADSFSRAFARPELGDINNGLINGISSQAKKNNGVSGNADAIARFAKNVDGIDGIIAKMKSNISLSDDEYEKLVPALRAINKEYSGMSTTQLKSMGVTKTFVNKTAPIAADAIEAGAAYREANLTPEITMAQQKMAAYSEKAIKTVIGEIPLAIDKEAQSASPSKRAIKESAKNIVDGILKPVEDAKTRSSKAGKGISDNLNSRVSDLRESRTSQIRVAGAKSTTLSLADGANAVDSYPIAAQRKTQSGATVRTPSPFMQDLKASTQNAMPRLRVAKQEFINDMKGALTQLKALFRIGGKDMVDSTRAGLIQETPRLIVAGKEAGFDYVTALKGGNGSIAAVVTSGNQKIISAALKEYADGGFRVAGSVHLGLDKGIAGSVARGIIAGEKLADSITEGVVKRSRKQKNLAMGEQGPLEPGGTRGTAFQRAKQKVSAGYNKLNSKTNLSRETTGQIASIGAAATMAAGALSAIPGPVGQFASSLMPLIGIVSAVSGIMSMFNISVVEGTIVMGAFGLPFWPVIAVLGAFAAVIGISVALNNQANEAKKKEIEAVTASAAAWKAAKGMGKEVGSLLGGPEVGANAFDKAVGARKSNAKNGKQASDIDTLLQSNEFTSEDSNISKFVGKLKLAGKPMAKSIISSYANELKAAGYKDDAIDAFVKAIQVKAGMTDLKLEFANIDITTKNGMKDAVNNIKSGVSGLAAAQSAYESSGDKKRIEDAQAAGPRGVTYNGRTGSKIAAETATEFKNRISEMKKSSTAFQAYSSILKASKDSTSSAVSSLVGSLGKGSLGTKQFAARIKEMTAGLKNSPDALAGLQASFNSMGPEAAKAAGSLTDVNEKLMLMAYLSSHTDAENAQILSDVNSGNTKLQAAAKAKYTNVSGIKTGAVANVVDTTSTDTTGADAPTNLIKEVQNKISSNKLASKFMASKFSQGFADMLVGADAKTQAQYVKANGVLTALGQKLKKTYDAQLLSDFNLKNKGILTSFNDENTVRKELVKAGLSQADAANAAADADTRQLMINALATPGLAARKKAVDALTKALKTNAEIDKKKAFQGKQDDQTKAITSLNDQAVAFTKLTAAGLSAADAYKVVEDAETASLIAQTGSTEAIKAYADGVVYLNNATEAVSKKKVWAEQKVSQAKSIEDAKNQVIAFDKLKAAGMSAADAIAAIGDAALASSIAQQASTQDIKDYISAAQQLKQIQESLKDPNQKIIDDAQKQIDVYQARITTYQDAQSLLQAQEQAINDTYNERIKALDKVQQINETILNQQKGQLNVADALSRGDIVAAARAAQDMRQQAASDSLKEQRQSLEDAKTAQINALSITVTGQTYTMKMLTEKIAELTKSVTTIKLNTIDPAAERLAQANSVITPVTSSSTINNPATTTTPATTVLVADSRNAPGSNISATVSPQRAAAMAAAALLGIPYVPGMANPLAASTAKSGGSSKPTLFASTGGMVPSYFARGGYSKGTDTVPAMLTPGEFIINRRSASKFGINNLRNINAGNFDVPGYGVNGSQGNISTVYAPRQETVISTSSPVYNSYSVNVNAGSNASSNDIARDVMAQIRSINSQQIRSNRI